MYKITVKLLGRLYPSEGATITEAIEKLSVGFARSTSIVTVEKDGIRQEKVLGRVLTSRLFSPSPNMKAAAIKNLVTRFNV